MAPAYTTVIGRCMGAGEIDSANYYFKKLNRITLVLSVAWNALVFAMTPIIVRYSAISAPAKELVIWLVLINNVFNSLAYPFAGPLGSGLRAAGDVKFTMWVSITLTIAARLLFSALFGLWLGWGGHWGSRGYEHRLGVSGSSVPLAAAFPAMEPVPAHLTIWE